MNPQATLRLLPQGLRVPLRPDQTLLEATIAAGSALPSACRNGSCRACMARVLEGTVRHRIAWPGLLAEELAQGWVLPCVAVAQGDVVLLQGPSPFALPGAAA